MTKSLIFITFVASLGGLLFGFDIAIISGTIPFIQKNFNLNEWTTGLGVSSLLFGCIAGSALAGRITDLYGRKRVLIYISLLFALSSLMTAMSTDFNFFVISRLLGGIAVGAASFISPLYISEIAPASHRGVLVSSYQLSIVTGILISYTINYCLKDMGENNWRWMFGSGVVPSVLFFAMLFWVPETPRWLYLHGKTDEALNVLKRIIGHEAIREFQAMNKIHVGAPVSYAALFRGTNGKIMIIGLGISFFVQFSGINTIIDYAPIILKSAGWDIDSALFSTFVIGFINLIFTVLSIFIIEKTGRKKLMMIGAIGMGLILGSFSILDFTGHFNGSPVLILILIYIAIFATCIGTVFWTLLSEIFPGSIRGRAMSVATLNNWFTNALVVLFFPYFIKVVGGGYTFGFLALMCFLMFLFTKYFVKETNGKSLEEIEIMFQH